MKNFFVKNKTILAVSVAVVIVLVTAFFMGGALDNNHVSKSNNKSAYKASSCNYDVNIASKQNSTSAVTSNKTTTSKSNTSAATTVKAASYANKNKAAQNNSSKTNNVQPTTEKKDKYRTDPIPEGKPKPVEPQEQTTQDTRLFCTLSISCSTINDNISKLDSDKKSLVPADGWILKPQKVEFTKGESVFSLLQRICKAKKIHMAFKWTPIYNSAYIEGINNLYEFDCGSLSGWMYCVNAWYPNYGSSRYELKDGDTVEWKYTCSLGSDIGGNNFAE